MSLENMENDQTIDDALWSSDLPLLEAILKRNPIGTMVFNYDTFFDGDWNILMDLITTYRVKFCFQQDNDTEVTFSDVFGDAVFQGIVERVAEKKDVIHFTMYLRSLDVVSIERTRDFITNKYQREGEWRPNRSTTWQWCMKILKDVLLLYIYETKSVLNQYLIPDLVGVIQSY